MLKLHFDALQRGFIVAGVKTVKNAFQRSKSMNYYKFGIALVLFLGLGVSALFMPSPKPCWAAGLPSPLSYWRLDDASQPYKDFSNSNDAECIDGNLDFCPERVPGIIDRAQLFDGASEGLDVPGNSFNWASTDSFTIAFWMKRPGPPPPAGVINNEVIVGREDRVESRVHWWIGVENVKGGAIFVLIDSDEIGRTENFYLRSAKTITDGEWHHVVAVRDAGQSSNILYVDGVREKSVSITYTGNFASSFADLNIGHLRSNDIRFNYHYEGAVDDVRIYKTALSENQIGDLFRLRPIKTMPWVPSILLGDE